MAWWDFGRGKRRELEQQVELLRTTLEDVTGQQISLPQNATIASMRSFQELFQTYQRQNGLFAVTADTAIRSSAVYACVRLIAGTIAALPLRVYKKVSHHERQVAENHPVLPLISTEPNPSISAVMFWESVLWFILLRGNAYAIIRRDRNGVPFALELMQPGWCHGELYRYGERQMQRIRYRTQTDAGSQTLDQDDILHFTSFGWNGVEGLSAITYAAQNAVGIALASDENSAAFFGNGGAVNTALIYPKKVDQKQGEIVRNWWRESHGGPDPAKWGLPVVLGDDAKLQRIGMTPQDAQLIDARRYQVADIARVFGVPPHLLGETDRTTSWGSGIEEQTRGFLAFTLLPHIERIEAEINRKLVRSNKYYAEFEVDGLRRGDTKTRAEYYSRALGGTQSPGWMTPNEVRRMENQAPVTGGDTLYAPAPTADTKQTAAVEPDAPTSEPSPTHP